MGSMWLLFSLPVCVFSALGFVLGVAGRADGQSYSATMALGQESGDSELIHPPHPPPHPPPPPITPPYLLLPMFSHHSAPAVSKELLAPGAGGKVFPSVLAKILVPQRLPTYIRVTPVNNNHGVEVWCGYSKVTVRINRSLLSFRSSSAHFRLGTCSPSRADGSVLYFQYDLNECGSSLLVINGQLLYANELLYRPESQAAVIRAMPLTLPVQCLYDRFYYSYKIGYLPERRLQSFHKTLVRKQVFSLSVRNENWEELGVNEGYILGQPMYFEVSAGIVSEDKSAYVEACHVTASEDSNSTQRYDVIGNFGCMMDSKRTGSQARFVSRQRNILRFSLDAFLFSDATSERFYLHCTVLVENASASTTAKSCTYSQSEHRWEELDGDAAVCTCCDSQCRPPGCTDSSSCVEHAVVTSKPWTLIQNEGFSEHHDQWLNTASGFILVQQPHHPEGVESCEQGVESREDEELHEVDEEEVLIGFAETENDEGMRDEEMDGRDAETVMKAEDKEEKEDVDAEEAQEEEKVMEKRG